MHKLRKISIIIDPSNWTARLKIRVDYFILWKTPSSLTRFTPAIVQSFASSLISVSSLSTGLCSTRKTLLLRSSHNVQMVSMAIEHNLSALFGAAALPASSTNHIWSGFPSFQCEGSIAWFCSHWATAVHNWVTYGHSVSIWKCVSMLSSHWQKYWLGQPRCYKRSAVQTRSWSNSHMKSLIFGGAHVFHTSLGILRLWYLNSNLIEI